MYADVLLIYRGSLETAAVGSTAELQQGDEVAERESTGGSLERRRERARETDSAGLKDEG